MFEYINSTSLYQYSLNLFLNFILQLVFLNPLKCFSILYVTLPLTISMLYYHVNCPMRHCNATLARTSSPVIGAILLCKFSPSQIMGYQIKSENLQSMSLVQFFSQGTKSSQNSRWGSSKALKVFMVMSAFACIQLYFLRIFFSILYVRYVDIILDLS